MCCRTWKKNTNRLVGFRQLGQFSLFDISSSTLITRNLQTQLFNQNNFFNLNSSPKHNHGLHQELRPEQDEQGRSARQRCRGQGRQRRQPEYVTPKPRDKRSCCFFKRMIQDADGSILQESTRPPLTLACPSRQTAPSTTSSTRRSTPRFPVETREEQLNGSGLSKDTEPCNIFT